ncbi:hypothetical protein [Methylobacterium sp. CM6246]
MAESSTITREMIEAVYRALAGERHADRPGGSHEMMSELNPARDAGLRGRGGGNG